MNTEGYDGEGPRRTPPPEGETPPIASGAPAQGPGPDVGPAAPPPSRTAFSDVTLRPPGERYGDGDLRPGGSVQGGMVMDERTFRAQYGGQRGQQPSGLSADDFARYDPMFPGQQRPGRGGGVGPWGPRRDVFPGEPDNDILQPPHGGPQGPMGGPYGGMFGGGFNRF